MNVADASGNTVQVYDRAGQLVFASRTAAGVTTKTRYMYVAGKPVAAAISATGGTWFTYNNDALGSPVAHTNGSGAITMRTRYEPYGKTAAGTDPTDLGFTGHVNDPATGLVYMQQRYYDPIAGRFLSLDPVGTDTSTGREFGRYTYVGNNPYSRVDPDGRQTTPNMYPNFDPMQYLKDLAFQSIGFISMAAGGAGGAAVKEGVVEVVAVTAKATEETSAGVKVVDAVTAVKEAKALAKGPKCFPAGTKIATPRGDINIEDVKVGDTVYAYDLKTGETVEQNVTELLRNFTYHWVDIQVGLELIRATRSHPFWVENKQEWVEAIDLKHGMLLRLENGQSAAITSITYTDLRESQPTYNLEVAVNHDYFVSASHVLVHNGDGSYTITFASGKQYVGKGDMSRMTDSAARISAQTGDRVVNTQWTPANGKSDAFVQEEMRMRASGGPGGNTYNQINSPGNNIAKESGCP